MTCRGPLPAGNFERNFWRKSAELAAGVRFELRIQLIDATPNL
jgi:hypothetical protein